MNEIIPSFSFGDAKRKIRNLINIWANQELEELIYKQLAEIEEQKKEKERSYQNI